MSIEIDVDVDELIRHYESEMPSMCNWLGRMVAITDGFVEIDDIEPLLLACASRADDAIFEDDHQRSQHVDDWIGIAPSWQELMSLYSDAFVELQADQGSDAFKRMCATIQKCGKVADWWNVKKHSPVTLSGEARRIVELYRKEEPSGFSNWFEIISGCFGIVDIKHVWTLLTACGEVADEGRAEQRQRLEREGIIDTGPQWRVLMAFYGRHFAELRGNPESPEAKDAARMMRECAEAADEWAKRLKSTAN